MSGTMAIRRPRRSLVVLVSNAAASEEPALALAGSLEELGIEATYLGKEEDTRRIAAAAVQTGADAVELCLSEGRGVVVLRELLRALIEVDRSDVSIVVHKGTNLSLGIQRTPGAGF
jgi:methylmalonyl-CoA mutase cobalamin-binding subunit